jgi:flagellar hook-basal body complex protein FliE
MNDDAPKNPKNQIDVNLSALNVDLRPLAELKGVFNNVINTIGRGCGRLYAPWKQVRWAKAEKRAALARADQTIELAKKAGELAAVVAANTQQPNQQNTDIFGRALNRFTDDLQRKQTNREAMANEMILALSDKSVLQDTEQEIEMDWVDDFFQIAENIGSYEIRAFWAKLLANEVAAPGSICRQTLHVLRSISAKTAERFSHFCRLSISQDNDVFVIHPHVFAFQNIGRLDNYGVQFEDLFDFESSGLIRSAETLMVNYATEPADLELIDLGGRSAEIQWAGNQVQLIKFTVAGREIRRALPLEPLETYANILRTGWEGKLRFNWRS